MHHIPYRNGLKKCGDTDLLLRKRRVTSSSIFIHFSKARLIQVAIYKPNSRSYLPALLAWREWQNWTMAIQFIALKPLNPLLPPQCKNSISLRRGSQLSVSAAASVAWEEQIPPNAVRRKRDPSWRGGFSLGVDLGLSRTGVAISKGFTVRPLTVMPWLLIEIFDYNLLNCRC